MTDYEFKEPSVYDLIIVLTKRVYALERKVARLEENSDAYALAATVVGNNESLAMMKMGKREDD